MDSPCTKCSAAKSGRCKSCAAFARWGKAYVAYYCRRCGVELTGRTRWRAKHGPVYCTVACKFDDPDLRAKLGGPGNSVTKVCPHCTSEFAVPVSNDARYTYCSRECSIDARGRSATCRRCGAAFRHGQAQTRRYCSETCRRPAVLTTCDHCAVEFRVVPSSSGKRRFCSNRCYRASDAETSIERIVRETLERLRLDHMPQAGIGPWVVDFLVGDQLVIEADGSYWHSLRPHVDRRKSADLVDRGYAVWRLTEGEIRDIDFPAAFARRLTDHEFAYGDLPRG